MAAVLELLREALADRYTIERELGRGGNAIVYLAHDRKHDRKVALKVIERDLAESVRAERFLREIQIAAKLSHPHILPLYDSGAVEGMLYYVMPYVEGESLRDRLTPREAAARSRTRSGSHAMSPPRWATPTRRAWCIGTSSRRTSC